MTAAGCRILFGTRLTVGTPEPQPWDITGIAAIIALTVYLFGAGVAGLFTDTCTSHAYVLMYTPDLGPGLLQNWHSTTRATPASDTNAAPNNCSCAAQRGSDRCIATSWLQIGKLASR